MLDNDPPDDPANLGAPEGDDFDERDLAYYILYGDRKNGDLQDDVLENGTLESGDLEHDELEDDELEEPGVYESADARIERLNDIAAPLIELEKIPPRLWKQTLAPYRHQQRMWAALRVPDTQMRDAAMALVGEFDLAACAAADARARTRNVARRTGHPLPSPGPQHPAARSSVQVNIRLRRDDHERLVHAATAVGLKPTTLARSLVLNGAAMILRDHGREHLAPPRPTYTPLRLD